MSCRILVWSLQGIFITPLLAQEMPHRIYDLTPPVIVYLYIVLGQISDMLLRVYTTLIYNSLFILSYTFRVIKSRVINFIYQPFFNSNYFRKFLCKFTENILLMNSYIHRGMTTYICISLNLTKIKFTLKIIFYAPSH